jgi:hypothetical protein
LLRPFAILARTYLPLKDTTTAEGHYLPLKDNLLLGAISQLSEKSRLGARRFKNRKRTGGAIMQSRTNDITFSFVAFAIAFIFILVATLWIP